MEKIILALDSLDPDESALRFACYLTRLTHSRLTGIFIENQQILFPEEEDSFINSGMLSDQINSKQAELLTEENIRVFTDITEKEGVHAFIEFNNEDSKNDIISKTRFADVIITSATTSISGFDENASSRFLRDILQEAECPVIISPNVFNGIDNIVFCYDGSKSSVFALKQFTYLFPELKYTRAKVIYLNKDDEFLEEDQQSITDWLNYHYSDVEFIPLKGNAKEAFFNYLVEKKNDIVVMGSYGRGLLDSFFRIDENQDAVRTTSMPIFISHY